MQQSFNLRDLVPMLAVDVAMPYCLYIILSPNFPSNSLIPLLIAALPPAIYGVVSIVRKRHIDYIGALVVLGILVTVVAAFVTRKPLGFSQGMNGSSLSRTWAQVYKVLGNDV